MTATGTYEPIERRKVYELIAERILAQISDRRLEPGDPLPTERELTARYGVGRSSVREALRILESKGLIQPAGNGSFVVAELRNLLNHSLGLLLTVEGADLDELFEVRRIVEAETAALAALRAEPEHLVRMEDALGEMEATLPSEAPFIAADLRFHLTIAEASRNRVALHLMHAIRELLHRGLASAYTVPGSPERAIDEHRGIVRAIAAGDADAARERMREHLLRVESDIDEKAVRL